jgi:hypothetical protein
VLIELKTYTLRNVGVGTLTINDGGLSISGDNASLFQIVSSIEYPVELALNQTVKIDIKFSPATEGMKMQIWKLLIIRMYRHICSLFLVMDLQLWVVSLKILIRFKHHCCLRVGQESFKALQGHANCYNYKPLFITKSPAIAKPGRS